MKMKKVLPGWLSPVLGWLEARGVLLRCDRMKSVSTDWFPFVLRTLDLLMVLPFALPHSAVILGAHHGIIDGE